MLGWNKEFTLDSWRLAYAWLQAYLAQQENGLARLKERVEVSEASMHVQADRLASAELQLSETAGKLQASVLDKIEEIPKMQFHLQKTRTQLASLTDQFDLLKNSKFSSEGAGLHAPTRFGSFSSAQPRAPMGMARPADLQLDRHDPKQEGVNKSAQSKEMAEHGPSLFTKVLAADSPSQPGNLHGSDASKPPRGMAKGDFLRMKLGKHLNCKLCASTEY